MKNKFLCFAVIAVTALVFIGCSSDEEKMGEKTKTDMMGDKMADDKIPGDMMMVGSVLEHGTITAGDGMGTQIRIADQHRRKNSHDRRYGGGFHKENQHQRRC